MICLTRWGKVAIGRSGEQQIDPSLAPCSLNLSLINQCGGRSILPCPVPGYVPALTLLGGGEFFTAGTAERECSAFDTWGWPENLQDCFCWNKPF